MDDRTFENRQVGQFMKYMRRQLSLSIEAIGQSLGKTASGVLDIEAGNAWVTRDEWERFCHLVDLPPYTALLLPPASVDQLGMSPQSAPTTACRDHREKDELLHGVEDLLRQKENRALLEGLTRYLNRLTLEEGSR